MNKQRRPRGTGRVFKYKGSDRWWTQYYRDGKLIRESSGSTKRTVAEKLLAQRLAEVSMGVFVDPRLRKITIDELHQAYVTDYRINAVTSEIGEEKATRAERRWKARLEKHFSGVPARNLTTDKLNEYVIWAQSEGLTNATINRDMSALKRAFNLARKATPPKITNVPYFPKLKESAPRKGFVIEAQFQKLIANATDLWFRALVSIAYAFGFRKSELTNLIVEQVNLSERSIRLYRGETKNDDGRFVPLTEGLTVLLQALVVGKNPSDFVFTRNDGSHVIDFRDQWYAACEKAGVGKFIEVEKDGKSRKKWTGLTFHDLRRSGARNMIRRGISQPMAMKLGGWKTPSVFQRYDIVDETDLRIAVEKIAAGAKAEQARSEQSPIDFEQSLSRAESKNSAKTLQIPAAKVLPD